MVVVVEVVTVEVTYSVIEAILPMLFHVLSYMQTLYMALVL